MEKIKVTIQQRVIPAYRVPFLEKLAQQPEIELYVFSGKPRPDEMIKILDSTPNFDYSLGNNIHLFRSSLYLCLQPDLLPWLKTKRPRVAIFEANPRYLSSNPSMKWLHNQHVGLIGWGLGVPQHTGPLSKIRSHLRQSYLQQFDKLLAYSQTGKEQYISAGVPVEKVSIAANASVGKPTQLLPERPLFFDNNRAKILFVGRLQPRKKIDSLLRACAQLDLHIQPEIWIAGDGSILEELRKIANSIYPQTKFFGAVYGNDLTNLYQSADLFILPGTGGLAIQEAMAAGLPVIIAEGDGSQSNLINSDNGWLIPTGDEDALKSTLEIALSNPQKLRQMGKAAFKIVDERVNIDQMVKVFLQTIIEVHEEKNVHEH